MPADRKIKLEIDAVISNGKVTIEMCDSSADPSDTQRILEVAIAAHLYRMWKVDENKLDFSSFLNAFDTFNTETLGTTLTFVKSIGSDPQKIIH